MKEVIIVLILIIATSASAQVGQKIAGVNAAAKADNNRFNLHDFPEGTAAGIFFDIQFSNRFYFSSTLLYNRYTMISPIWLTAGSADSAPYANYSTYSYFELPVGLLFKLLQSPDQKSKLLIGSGISPSFVYNVRSGDVYDGFTTTEDVQKSSNGFYLGYKAVVESRFNIIDLYSLSIGADATLVNMPNYAPFSIFIKFGKVL